MKTAPASPDSFETALQALEDTVRTLEVNQTSLEDSLAAYERGMQLLAYCRETLEQAEQKIRVLESGVLADFAVKADGKDA